MFDYLNEFLLITGRTNRRNGTYKKAMEIKRRGDSYIFNLLCEEWISRFKWKSEEKTIATELIEKTILLDGMVGLAKLVQKNGPYIEETWRNFKVTGLDNQSFYGYTNRCTLTDYVGRTIGQYIPVQDQDLSDTANCVIIYDNVMGWTPILTILYYAERLSMINSSINGCIQNILGTTIITCEPEQARDIERQRAAASVGVPYVLKRHDGEINPTPMELMSTSGASDELKTLFEAFDKVHADYLQSIGIRANNEMNKKSGVTPMEIIENRQNVDIVLNASYEMRKKGIEQCKRIGLEGLSVSVDNFEGLTNQNFDSHGNLIENDSKNENENEDEDVKEENENV